MCPLLRALGFCAVGGTCDGDLGIQQLKDPLRGRHRGLKRVELLRHVADRPEEPAGVEDERHERAERERAAQDEPAAVPENQRGRDGRDELDRRQKHGVEENLLDVGVAMLAVDELEAAVVHLLAAEQLHRRHAVDVLVEERVDARDPQAHLPVGLAHVPPEPLRQDENQRQHREGDQRKPPVHPQQRHHDADEHEQIAERRDDARREQIVDDVDVGRHARHQPPDGIAIVERQIQPLQMRVDLHAHVEHDALADHLHHVGLGVLERERRNQHRQVHQRDVVEAGKVALGDVLVDGDLDQIRRRELRHRVADQRQQRTGHVPLVRTQVPQQAAHEPRVVGLAEDFFFVERHEGAG